MTMIETLVKRGNKAALAVMDAYNPDQERDEKGMWTSGASATAEKASATANASGSREDHHVAAEAHAEAKRVARAASNAAIQAKASIQERAPYDKAFWYHAQKEVEHVAASHASQSSSARTMTELPAIKETPSANLAMSQRVPAGNQRPVMGNDPNRVTQKEMPALTDTEHAIMRAVVSSKSDTKALQSAGLTREQGINAVASVREKLGIAPHESVKEAYTSTFGGRGSKQSRQEKAAAAAGEWASKALSAKTTKKEFKSSASKYAGLYTSSSSAASAGRLANQVRNNRGKLR